MSTFFQAALTYIALWWPLVFICLILNPPLFYWPPTGSKRRLLNLGIMPRKFLTATITAFILWIIAFPLVHSGIMETTLIEWADRLPRE